MGNRRTILFCTTAVGVLVSCCRGAWAGDLILAENGTTDYQIVIAAAPPLGGGDADEEVYWRERLSALLLETAGLVQSAFAANGAVIPVVAEDEADAGKPGIYLGNSRRAREVGIDRGALVGWSYVHRVVGRDVFITGRDALNPGAAHLSAKEARKRFGLHVGTVKAVADFLRRYAGVRFLYPGGLTGVTFLPTPVIHVPAELNRRVTPLLRYNAPGGFYRRHGVVDLSDALYLVANNFFPITEIDYRSHQYTVAVPLADYRGSHPEYFALIGGKRIVEGEEVDRPHYCLSNPRVRELIHHEVRNSFDRGYGATTLSQQDGFRACQCDRCRDLYGTGDDWGAKLWTFHRAVAERFLTERPGQRIMLSAYGPTLQPPKSVREFPENVSVELCLYVNPDTLFDAWRPVRVPGGYHAFLYIFGRRTAMGYNPQNTPLRMGCMVKDFHAFGIHSIYMDGFGQGFGLAGPTYYVLGRMWDDPEGFTVDTLLDEYYEAAFREAEKPMRVFFDVLFGALEPYSFNSGGLTSSYGRPCERIARGDPMGVMRKVYPIAVLVDLDAALSRAEAMARSEKVRRRLGLVRLEFDHLRHIAMVAHRHGTYEADPSHETRARLLAEVERWHAYVDTVWRREGGVMKREPVAGWPERRPFRGYPRVFVADWRVYRETPLTWNTEEARKAPLPGARRLNVCRGDAAADATMWAEVKGAVLQPIAADGEGVAAQEPPTLRAMFDTDRLFIRIDVPKAVGPVSSWDVVIDPFGDCSRYYRFTAGPDGDTRRDAAFGFITEDVHPLYGKEDPTWSGAWEIDIRGRTAVFSISFETLGVQAPGETDLWRGNVGVKTDETLWQWVVRPGVRDTADRNCFGEFHFGEIPARPPGRAAQVAAQRERLYRDTFRIPEEWQALPGLLTDPFGEWVFRADPLNQGLEKGWERPDADTSGWRPIPVPAFWAETEAGGYLGYGWYRTKLGLPAEAKGKPLRLLFGGVDTRAWVYVNGRLVAEPEPGRIWTTPFVVDVGPERLDNTGGIHLVIRVHADKGNAGIWRPVWVQMAKTGKKHG